MRGQSEGWDSCSLGLCGMRSGLCARVVWGLAHLGSPIALRLCFSSPRCLRPPPCSTLAGLPRLRLLSLTVTAALPGDSHRQLAQLSALEELHLYLQPSQPTQFEFQPGAQRAAFADEPLL